MWKKYHKIDNKYIIGIDPCNETTKNTNGYTIVTMKDGSLIEIDVTMDGNITEEELIELLLEQLNSKSYYDTD